MREDGRRRGSKWDLVPESHLKSETGRDNEQDERHNRNSWRGQDAHAPNWSDVQLNDSIKGKDDIGWSSWEAGDEDKCEGRSRNAVREEISATAGSWGADKDYSARKLPRHESWRERSRSHSPRSRWSRRPHRSRSPDPEHGFKVESERWTDRSRSGSRGSDIPCKDFIAGRCRRQNDCRYLHDYGDGRKHYDAPHSETRGRTRHERGESAGYLSSTNEAHTASQDPQKDSSRSLIPRHHFQRGASHRGSACTFLHQGVADVKYDGFKARPLGRTEEDVAHHRRNEPESHRTSHIPCKFFAEGRCHNGDNCRFSHQSLVQGGVDWSLKVDSQDQDTSKPSPLDWSKWGKDASNGDVPSQGFGDKNGEQAGLIPDSRPQWSASTWGHVASDNTSLSAKWGATGNNDTGTVIEASRDQESQSIYSGETLLNIQNTVQYRNCGENMKIQLVPTEDTQVSGYNNQMHISANNAQYPPTAQNFSQSLPSPLIVLPPPNNSDIKPSWVSDSQPFSDQNNREKDKLPDMTSSKILPVTSDALGAANAVTSEQVAQLSHLSASLAQMLANGNTLPQLYASLNPSNAHTEGNSAVQQSQCDLSSDTEKPKWAKESELYSGVSSNSFLQVHPGAQEPQAPITLFPSSTTDLPTEGDHLNNSAVEEKTEMPLEDHEKTQVELGREAGVLNEADGPNPGENEKEHAGGAEDKEADGDVDAESKRSKDARAVRAFKFALVEFVKELLKPTWKEGQMSKETHKTIVKKVVDKVTGTLTSPNIPQTQEKIDLYLAHSKPKVSKLVQAYVEKYMKS